MSEVSVAPTSGIDWNDRNTGVPVVVQELRAEKQRMDAGQAPMTLEALAPMLVEFQRQLVHSQQTSLSGVADQLLNHIAENNAAFTQRLAQLDMQMARLTEEQQLRVDQAMYDQYEQQKEMPRDVRQQRQARTLQNSAQRRVLQRAKTEAAKLEFLKRLATEPTVLVHLTEEFKFSRFGQTWSFARGRQTLPTTVYNAWLEQQAKVDLARGYRGAWDASGAGDAEELTKLTEDPRSVYSVFEQVASDMGSNESFYQPQF
jgi:hypothetical protein